jgi:hypothetical protein
MKNKVTHLLLIAFLFVFLCGFSACSRENKPSFGIYLADSGELVLSEEHIAAYYQDTHTIELNETGIAKWNSYLDYTSTPKLADSLFSKDFILRVKGEEIYRGKFYSGVSSMSYDGYVILESLFKMDKEKHSITIEHGYPSPSFSKGEDKRSDARIIKALKDEGILR